MRFSNSFLSAVIIAGVLASPLPSVDKREDASVDAAFNNNAYLAKLDAASVDAAFANTIQYIGGLKEKREAEIKARATETTAENDQMSVDASFVLAYIGGLKEKRETELRARDVFPEDDQMSVDASFVLAYIGGLKKREAELRARAAEDDQMSVDASFVLAYIGGLKERREADM